MYAYSEDNIYCVGRNGAIYHITSSGWYEIESGTETYLSDIWGVTDPFNGEEMKFITGLHLGPNDETKLLRMNGQNIVEDLNWDQNSDLSSVWSHNGIPIFAAGNELLMNKTGDWENVSEILFQYYVTCVRGTALNDIFVSGTLGLMAHYNGVEWLIFDNIAPGAIFGSVNIKGNTVCIVGEVGSDAIIVMGKRTN